MRTRSAEPTHEARAARIAWLVSFLATLALVALLSFAYEAQAALLPAPAAENPFASLGLEEEFEEEEEEEEEEELWEEEEWEEELEGCEEPWEEELEGEGEFEAGCEEEEFEEPGAEECIVTSAVAKVVARPRRKRLELTVRYRAERSAPVVVRWGLRGRRGGLDLGSERARISRAGSLHHRERLSRKQLRRALAAREFRVAVRAVNTPSYCRREFDLRLRARQASRGRTTWTERRR